MAADPATRTGPARQRDGVKPRITAVAAPPDTAGSSSVTPVLPPALPASAQRLREAAHRRGLPPVRLPTFEVPAGLHADHLHAGPSFADAVAPLLGIAPLEAPHDWLAGLPRDFTRREITLIT